MKQLMKNVTDKVESGVDVQYRKERWFEVSKSNKKYQIYLAYIISDYNLTPEQVSQLDNPIVYIQNGKVVEYKVGVPTSMIWDCFDDWFICWALVI